MPDEILRALAKDLKERGGLDFSECFIDATLVSAKKAAVHRWEKDQAGQRYEKLMALADRSGLPLAAVHAQKSASAHEVALIEAPLAEAPLAASFAGQKPESG
ncbi:MAG: hypothetical protein AVDCRST_MAG93-2975 [uncultured Chloroflexia bacterium]|uniref:Uncharacterized protein n=1 Tax=uncultured Chloroflexia bacterium TaxID=1672391 RepID=A0A6J4JHD0_9CHLR|nr:MAG: hypothetical protein AVDCRST_MAG93-2975 [uncultured Chloroflexia bacterium]